MVSTNIEGDEMKIFEKKFPLWVTLGTNLVLAIIFYIISAHVLYHNTMKKEEEIKHIRMFTYADAMIDVMHHQKSFAELDDFDVDVMKQSYYELIQTNKYYYFTFETGKLLKRSGDYKRVMEIRMK